MNEADFICGDNVHRGFLISDLVDFISGDNVHRGFLVSDLVDIVLLDFCFDSVSYAVLFQYISSNNNNFNYLMF